MRFVPFEAPEIPSLPCEDTVRSRPSSIQKTTTLALWPQTFSLQKEPRGVPTGAQWVKSPTAEAWATTAAWVWSLAQHSRLKIWHCCSCGVGHGCGSDLALLWLCCGPAAIALVGPLAWEPPYATIAALNKQTNRMSKELFQLNNKKTTHFKSRQRIWIDSSLRKT